jgi:hypothetical protein
MRTTGGGSAGLHRTRHRKPKQSLFDCATPARGALPASGPNQGEAIRATSCWIDRNQNGRRLSAWAKFPNHFFKILILNILFPTVGKFCPTGLPWHAMPHARSGWLGSLSSRFAALRQ